MVGVDDVGREDVLCAFSREDAGFVVVVDEDVVGLGVLNLFVLRALEE